MLTCPFIAQCDLPKHHFICGISGFKTCSEYILRYNKLKQHRVLYGFDIEKIGEDLTQRVVEAD